METTGNHNIEMPKHTSNLSNEDKVVLFEFYNAYSNRQWFNRAEIITNHPAHLKKALEIHCAYNPLLEMKEILSFTQKHNISLEIVDLSHAG